MYIPPLYRNRDTDDIKAFIAANGFALLISHDGTRPVATHIPLLQSTNSEGRDILTGHLSKANPQWKTLSDGQEVLAVFSGAHAYISSSWYDHENVPTWNYLAVHVYGQIRLLGQDELLQQVTQLVDKYEMTVPHPISVAGMDPDMIKRELQGIVGVEILISDIQATRKLSQNRDRHNKERIIQGLEQQGRPDALNMAVIMKKDLDKTQ